MKKRNVRMHRLTCAPASRRLRLFVRAFAQRDVDHRVQPVSQFLPARLEEILEFQFEGTYQLSGACGGHVTPPPSAIVGIYTRNDCAIHFSEKSTPFAILFQPHGMSGLFGIPAFLLAGNAFDARAVLGPEIDRLHEWMAEARSFQERTGIAENFLFDRLKAISRDQHPIEAAARHILDLGGAVRLTEVAAGTGLGWRQFERRFQQATGLGPKVYARLARFQRALDFKLRSPCRTWIDIAHHCGYHDQMHMIRDFRNFAGHAPKKILASLGDARPEALMKQGAISTLDLTFAHMTEVLQP